MLGPASVLQSVHRLAGHPLSPSKDWRPGFSIGLVPILTAGAYVPDDIGISSSAAPPGPFGPARCRLSRRRELRLYGVLRSSHSPNSRKFSKLAALRRIPLALSLLDRVVDCLSDDLAVLDQVGVSAVPHPDVVVLIGPLQESHPPFDGSVSVLERAVFGQFLTQHPSQLPNPLVPVKCAPVYEDHEVLRDVAADVLLDDALDVPLGPPVFGQVEVIVEHFLGGAVTQVLHNDPPSPP